MDEAPAPPSEDSEVSGDPIPEPPSFPRAAAGTGDVPSWIDGAVGSTDPDLLSDFKFEAEPPEASFPEAQPGEILEDDSIFKPRVIPEEMNAKLKTPVELPGANGDQEYAPPQHEGPITIQAPQADTQMFRKVLKELDGFIRGRLRSMQLKKWKKPKKFQRMMIRAGYPVDEAKRTWLRMNKWQSVARPPVRFVLNLDWFRRRSLLFLDDFTQRNLKLEFAR